MTLSPPHLLFDTVPDGDAGQPTDVPAGVVDDLDVIFEQETLW